MRARVTVAALLFAGTTMGAVGCTDPTVKQLNEIKTTVCACATLACADQALTAMPTAPARRIDKAQAVASEIFTCYSRLAKAGEAVPEEPPAPPTTGEPSAAATPTVPPTVPLAPNAPAPTISPTPAR